MMSKYNFKSYDGARVQKRGYRRNEAWDEHKDFILGLVQRGQRQRDILEALKNERGFKTNLNQLKSKLGIWGASSKNLGKKQRRWIYLMSQRRQAEGKKTVFYFGDTGQEVTDSQMGSIMRSSEKDLSAVPASPGDLEMATPPPMDSDEGEEPIEDLQSPETDTDQNVRSSEKEVDAPILGQENCISSPIENTPGDVSAGTLENDSPPVSPSLDQPFPSTETPVSFDEIYKKVLQKLDSFHLATNSSVAVASTAQTLAEEAVSPSPDLENAIRDWPGPNSNEYTEDLGEWMEELFDDSVLHFEAVDDLMKTTGLPFPLVRDEIIAQWVEEYEEDPLPYHICCAIVEGRPVTPVVNGWEDTPQKIPQWVQDRSTLQRHVWIPTIRDTMLTTEEWERIDHLHTKHFKAIRKKCRKVEKSNKDDEAVTEFRQCGAHLQFLRYTFGEWSFFTVAALGAFAYTCYQLIIDDDDSIFLLECALKAYEAIGLCWHEKALNVYTPLGHLLDSKGDTARALVCYQNAFAVTEFRYGPESSACAAQIAYLASLSFKLGSIEEGDMVLKMGLKNIQTAAAKAPLCTQDNPHNYILAMEHIAALYKRVKGDKISVVVAKWAVQEFQTYRKMVQMEDNLAPLAKAVTSVGRVYSMVQDYGNAVQMHQWAFDINSGYYGENDTRSLQSIRSMCKAMSKRGLIIYVVPILEKTWRLCQDTEDDTELKGPAFEVWMDYSKAVLKLSGHGDEFKELKKRLAY